MKFTALFVAAVSAQCDDIDSSGYDTLQCCSEDQVDNIPNPTICPNGAVPWEDDTTMVTEDEADDWGDDRDGGEDDGGSGLPPSCETAEDCEEG